MKFKIEEKESGHCIVYYKKWWMLWFWGYVYYDIDNINNYMFSFYTDFYTKKYRTISSLKEARKLIGIIKRDFDKPKEKSEKPKVYFV